MPEVGNAGKRGRNVLLELGVIVLGVLIALGVDEWRESLRDRASEVDYVERLVADLEMDVERLTHEVQRMDPKIETLETLLVAPNAVASGSVDLRSVAGDLAAASWAAWGKQPPHRVTFDELLSTGALSLLRRTDLRQGIAEYYRDFDFYSELLVRRISPLPELSYRLVPRADGADFTAGDLSDAALARLRTALSTEEFVDAITAEMNRTRHHRARGRELLEAATTLRTSLSNYLAQ